MTVSRRRPGDASPIREPLTPNIEAIHTPATQAPLLTAVPAMEPEVTVPLGVVDPAPETPETPPAPAAAPAVESDEKKAVTIGLSTLLKKQAETAVLRTSGYEGGYRSMAALVDGAIRRELERLSHEFNGGEPFPANNGGFRQGRPLGS